MPAGAPGRRAARIFFYYIKEKGRSAALGRGGNRSSTQSRHSLRNCLLVDGGIDVLRGPRDYTSVSQALATAGYNGEQIVVVAPTDVQPIRALSLAGTDQLRRAGMNVDFHEMEQGASIRRRQNQAAPDKGGWSAFFGLVDRSLPNNASCSRCPLSTSHGTPASSRALRMIDQILFCGAARFALEPRAIGEPPSCQAAPTVSHPPIIIGVGEGSIITVLLTIDIQLSIEYHHSEIA